MGKWIDNLAVRWLLWRKRPVVMNVTFDKGISITDTMNAVVIHNTLTSSSNGLL